MIEFLLPGADLVTPNLFEASQLAKSGPIRSKEQMEAAAVPFMLMVPSMF